MALDRVLIDLSSGEALTSFSRRFRHKTYREKHFGKGITSWFGLEGGDLDILSSSRCKWACDTFAIRSGVPRNVQKCIDLPASASVYLKTISFVVVLWFTAQPAQRTL